MKKFKQVMVLLFVALITPFQTFASEADIAIPDLHAGEFHIFGQIIKAWDFLFYGALVICFTLGIKIGRAHV